MEKQDLIFMKEAIEWASDCHPVNESIPSWRPDFFTKQPVRTIAVEPP
jgi:hypothetical protein